ncbi:hypothetical protein ACB098_02G007800 [Castanea mollissima]
MITTMTLQLIVLLLGVTSMLLLIVAAPPPPPQRLPPPSSCSDELVLFSPCLSYVSSPPNNLSNTASDSCCDAFSSALNSTNGVCLCYLVRQPSILGFPVNDTRVLSLSSVCPIGEDNNSSIKIGSLESLCSGLNDVHSPPNQFAKTPPTQQNSSLEPARISSATTTKQLCSSYSCFASGIVILLVPISIHLYSSCNL